MNLFVKAGGFRTRRGRSPGYPLKRSRRRNESNGNKRCRYELTALSLVRRLGYVMILGWIEEGDLTESEIGFGKGFNHAGDG